MSFKGPYTTECDIMQIRGVRSCTHYCKALWAMLKNERLSSIMIRRLLEVFECRVMLKFSTKIKDLVS